MHWAFHTSLRSKRLSGSHQQEALAVAFCLAIELRGPWGAFTSAFQKESGLGGRGLRRAEQAESMS